MEVKLQSLKCDLLSEAVELSEPVKEEINKEEQIDTDLGITVELIQRMADWDKRRRILKNWQWKVLNEVATGKRQLDSCLAWGCKKSLDILKNKDLQRFNPFYLEYLGIQKFLQQR